MIAAAVVFTAGSAAAFAQSSSQGSSSMSSGSATDSSNSMSDMSSSNSASTSQNGSEMSSNNESSSSSSKKLSWGDRRFVTKAADDGMEEVQLAQLAAQQATNPEVKQFAQQMAEQHQQVNSQLMSIAESKNVKIDKDDETKSREYKRLSKASGSDFDREFVERMVDDHEKDIKLFEKAANNAKDPEIRQFASSTLDHLRQHLTQVQQLQQSIVPTGHTGKNSWRTQTSGSSSSSTPSASSSMSGAGESATGTSSTYSPGASSGTSSTSTSSTR